MSDFLYKEHIEGAQEAIKRSRGKGRGRITLESSEEWNGEKGDVPPKHLALGWGTSVKAVGSGNMKAAQQFGGWAKEGSCFDVT